MFTSARGGPLHGAWVTHTFQRVLTRAGLRRLRFHDLRHGVATLLVASGVSLKLVADYLGHAGIGTTDAYYVHLAAAVRHDIAERLAGLLQPGPGDGGTPAVGWRPRGANPRIGHHTVQVRC